MCDNGILIMLQVKRHSASIFDWYGICLKLMWWERWEWGLCGDRYIIFFVQV